MRYRLFLALSVGTCIAVAAACSGGGETSMPPDHGDGGTQHDSGSAGGPVADASSDANDDAPMDAGPSKPPECDEVTLAGALQSSQMTNPEAYAAQPDLLATPLVGGSTGDSQHPNRFAFYLDAADTTGTYAVSAFDNYFYAIANGGGINAEYTADAGTPGYSKRYVAVSGTITVTSVLTPHQTEGTLSNVRFDEATKGSDGSVTLVPGGSCLWLKEATWNTKRTGGCTPFTSTSTCAAGQYCMPTDSIGDDGVCVATGTKQLGDGCTLTTPPAWDSDCAPGLRCAMFSIDAMETTYTCHQLCDVRSANDGCPSSTHCGGDYNVCIPTSVLLNNPQNGNEIDTVATVGQVCMQNPKALYCGASGTPGTCFQDTGATDATCRPWAHALSECASGDSGGYVTYKQGIDSSTLFCFK